MKTLSQQCVSEITHSLVGTVLPAFSQRLITITQQEYIQLKLDASFWRTQHSRAITREAALKELLKIRESEIHAASHKRIDTLTEELKHKEAIIRDLKQRLYGKQSEKGKCNSESSSKNTEKKSRGQQTGSRGHGRTQSPNLPVVDEFIPLNETACATCGKAYSPMPDEESNIIEIEVSAHVRRIKRQSCAKNCSCPGPKIVTAPAPQKLIAKSPYSHSVWEEILFNKFLHSQPINRILNNFKSLGFNMSSGTVADGLKKLRPLFEPIYSAFHQKQMTENRFHNDETRWEVYEQIEGKVGHRHYLWLMRSVSVVYYCIDPTRSADVPIAHYTNAIKKLIIIVCDRYSAYKKLARLNLAIILAFCWVHVRRDFLNLARSYPDLNTWGLDWAEKMSELFHLNKLRVESYEPALSVGEQGMVFHEHHQVLGFALNTMKSRCDTLLELDKIARDKKEKTVDVLASAQRKVLESLQKHWQGLMVFYDYPDVKMDNNPAEQSMRNPVLGRNGYYGSGSLWSAQLAAMMFSLFQTMILWKLNPRTWLRKYLAACAENSGQAPKDIREFLPWSMSAERLKQMSLPPGNNTS